MGIYEYIPLIWTIVIALGTIVIVVIGQDNNEFGFGALMALWETGFYRLLIKFGIIEVSYYEFGALLSLKGFFIELALQFIVAFLTFKITNKMQPSNKFLYVVIWMVINSILIFIYNSIILPYI